MQDSYLTYFLTELAGTTAMIFTRTCDNTRRLALMLRNLGFDALPIHGQMSQPKRLGALNKFKGGDRSILVATGVSTSLHFHHTRQCLHHDMHAIRGLKTAFRVADGPQVELWHSALPCPHEPARLPGCTTQVQDQRAAATDSR